MVVKRMDPNTQLPLKHAQRRTDGALRASGASGPVIACRDGA